MIFDLHNDFLTSPEVLPKADTSKSASLLTDFDSLNGSLPDFSAHNYSDNITYAVWTTRLNNPVAFIKQLAKQQIKNTAIEDLHFVNAETLHLLSELKPLYASLTWNGENALAGGSDTDIGITDWGKDVIKFLNQSGIFLDVAHLNKTAFYQAISASNAPVVCSHTCFSRLFDHRRNLDYAQTNTLVRNGGIIGLCLVADFMGKKVATSDDVVRQIDYFAQKFGADNLCIGSDFYGTTHPALKDYCEFDEVEKRLLKLGYAKNDIDKIFYKNAMDFFSIKTQ